MPLSYILSTGDLKRVVSLLRQTNYFTVLFWVIYNHRARTWTTVKAVPRALLQIVVRIGVIAQHKLHHLIYFASHKWNLSVFAIVLKVFPTTVIISSQWTDINILFPPAIPKHFNAFHYRGFVRTLHTPLAVLSSSTFVTMYVVIVCTQNHRRLTRCTLP